MTDYINYFGDSTDINAPILKINEKRCKKCNKLLGYINGNYEIKCPRCGEMNVRKENVEDENIVRTCRSRKDDVPRK